MTLLSPERQNKIIIELLVERRRASYNYICSYLEERGIANKEGDVKYLLDELTKEGMITPDNVRCARYSLTERGMQYYSFWKEYGNYLDELEIMEEDKNLLYSDADYNDMEWSEERSNHDPEWKNAAENPEMMAWFFDEYKIKT